MKADGILLLNKARGMASTRALTIAKKQLQIKKAGHGGTLDPLADGVLLLLFGEATRYAQYLLHGNKSYTAKIRFGYRSDTDDAEGTLTTGNPPPPDLETCVRAALPMFCGEIMQTAPAYSALKHQGKPLYRYARNNLPAPTKTRAVQIDELTLLAVSNSNDSVTLSVRCGGGVYIRSLARDLGEALGCGAHLTALTRTTCGQFSLPQATTLTALDELEAEQCREHLLPLETIVAHFPALTLSLTQVQQLGNGIRVAQDQPNADNPHRVLSPEGRFAGLAEYHEGSYRPLYFLSWTRQALPIE